MSNIALRVENLSKKYQITAQGHRHDTFRDLIVDKCRGIFSRNGSSTDDKRTFWALNDVSFQLKKGEALGVIGRNGAGKSTLLKILSRITEPTSGEAILYGRVGSLLEVGTGFHGELSGRENIFLSGAILGMRKTEITRKFDEIVDFSGVERFIDTPVKRYSSGMYVRLAFAVAAHLEPEILIIDEVLAVGDSAFQKKCLGKMGEVASQGRTVLFVSHHMPSVLGLCPSAILLEDGQVAFDGPSSTAVEKYLNSSNQCTAEKVWDPEQLPHNSEPFWPISIRVCNFRGVVSDLVRSTEPVQIEMTYEVKETISDLRIQFKLYSALGETLFMSSDTDDPNRHKLYFTRTPGRYTSRCHIPGNLLNKGVFVVGVSATVPTVHRFFLDQQAVRFAVDESGGVGSNWVEERGGFFRPALDWDIEPVQHHETPRRFSAK
jgi:lipopolysaccharide transport system ATP-binding protein